MLFTEIRSPVIGNLFDRQPGNDGISLLPQRLNTCAFDSSLSATHPLSLYPLPWPPATLPGETTLPRRLQTLLKGDPELWSKYGGPANLSKVWGYRWPERGRCTICSVMSWRRTGTGVRKREKWNWGKEARWPAVTSFDLGFLSAERRYINTELSLIFQQNRVG